MDEPTMTGIKIKTTGNLAHGTKVFDGAGTEIQNVKKIVVTFEPESFVTAEITAFVGAVDIDAVGILSLQSTKDSAAAHGYDLVKRA